MVLEWMYRHSAAGGTVVLALAAGLIGTGLSGGSTALEFDLTTGVSVAFIGGTVGTALVPLYTPQPRSIPTVVKQAGRQLGLACLLLVLLGSSGVPIAPDVETTVIAGSLLLATLPAWYLVCQRWTAPQRVLVVGNELPLLEAVIQSLPDTPYGFLSPDLTDHTTEGSRPDRSSPVESEPTLATDGGVPGVDRLDSISGVDRLNGLSRLEHAIQEHNIETVAIAVRSDRKECFGILQTCREQGVDVLAHESLADYVLEIEQVGDELIRVDLRPWPWYSRLGKRAFDLAFATAALVVTAPLLLVIAVAIKLDSPGPVLYGQLRRATLGGRFPVWKFRSMVPDSEDADPANGADRITSVGVILRKTHFDEIPQLVSILVGDMSVVGPRAVWIEEEELLQREVKTWTKRWTVKPGLTGLAQVRDIDSTDGQAKLKCDLEYIERQSLWFDMRIVLSQLWLVIKDTIGLVLSKV